MNSTGPFVSAALFCQAVIHEKDEHLSVMRILDTITIHATEANPVPLPIVVQSDAFISFKSGGFVGEKPLTIEFVNEQNIARKPAQTFPALKFNGGEHGANVIIKLNVEIHDEGLYYLNVILGEDLMTRVPLKVVIKRLKESHTGSVS